MRRRRRQQLLAAVADFGNGVSAVLPFDGYVFINADLHVHLWREPAGEWIGLDSRTVLSSGGTATATSVVHDLDGPVGQAFLAIGRASAAGGSAIERRRPPQ